MKTVLCYGDSNTHGTPPLKARGDFSRFDRKTRWPALMQALLGEDWHVIEEGLPARTTVRDDPIEGLNKNGRTPLRALLETHKPIDVIVLMLGTNDLKHRFAASPHDIAAGNEVLISDMLATPSYQEKPPAIVLVCPPPIELVGWLGDIFEGGAAKSRELPKWYEAVAKRTGARFVDAGRLIKVSPVDGIHYDPPMHRILAEALAPEVKAAAG